jgi:ArsR family transcriptional regulator
VIELSKNYYALIIEGVVMKTFLSMLVVIGFAFVWLTTSGSCSCNKKKKTVQAPTKETIKGVYSEVAETKGSCSFGGKSCACRASVSQELGYTREQLEELAAANLGLGCGNPAQMAEILQGQTVIDLGSGAGMDCFIVASKVGPTGNVIGIDVSAQMVALAKENAHNYGYTNVEFVVGDIEHLPLKNDSADAIISNCVMSLAIDKKQAFQEAWRVLKSGGTLFASDLVLYGELTPEQRNDAKLRGTCALSAIAQDEYVALLKEVGFDVIILEEDREIATKKFSNESLPILSLHYKAHKKSY